MPDFIRPSAVRETSGTVRKAGKSGRIAGIEPCDPMPEGKLPLEKTPIGARFKKCAPNVGRMFPFYIRKTAEKEEKNRKGDERRQINITL